MSTETRPPFLPFSLESAQLKVHLAEDAWNTRDPEQVALAYTPDSQWRNRAELISGRQEIVAFPKRKWSRELAYRLIKWSARRRCDQFPQRAVRQQPESASMRPSWVPCAFLSYSWRSAYRS
jgi:nuclear transport factor 2 (NTF2) superfamily protein